MTYAKNLERRKVQIFPAKWLVRGTLHAIDRYELTGKRFGRLVVLVLCPKRSDNGSKVWLCRCDCGKLKKQVGTYLRKKGAKASCGCWRAEIEKQQGLTIGNKYGAAKKGKEDLDKHLDLTGFRSGRLEAKEKTADRKKGNVVWRCICDCGNEVLVEAVKLVTQNNRAKRTSCGKCSKKGIKHKRRITSDKF